MEAKNKLISHLVSYKREDLALVQRTLSLSNNNQWVGNKTRSSPHQPVVRNLYNITEWVANKSYLPKALRQRFLQIQQLEVRKLNQSYKLNKHQQSHHSYCHPRWQWQSKLWRRRSNLLLEHLRAIQARESVISQPINRLSKLKTLELRVETQPQTALVSSRLNNSSLLKRRA
jgi:hypothetical protein